jgi:hypothetical protein
MILNRWRLPGRMPCGTGAVFGILCLLLAGCATGTSGAGSAEGSGAVAVLPPPPETLPVISGPAHRVFAEAPDIVAGQTADAGADYSTAASDYRRAADQGNPVGQYFLASLYDDGAGVTRDPTEAARQYHLAAMAGYPLAQTALGDKYDKGHGVARDHAVALRWYRLAAERYEDVATARLALALLQGDGVTANPAEALGLLQRCATPSDDPKIYHPDGTQGGPGCQAMLGAMYIEGLGVPRDMKLGISWLTQSATQGLPVAEEHLADIYATGQGISPDTSYAAYWRARAKRDAGQHPGSWSVP